MAGVAGSLGGGGGFTMGGDFAGGAGVGSLFGGVSGIGWVGDSGADGGGACAIGVGSRDVGGAGSYEYHAANPPRPAMANAPMAIEVQERTALRRS